MTRILSILALPFIAVAMLLAPMFGLHFCPEEAIPLLAGAASLPFIGPLLKRRSKAHCCDKQHTMLSKALDPVYVATAGQKRGPPLPDIDPRPAAGRALTTEELNECFDKAKAADNIISLKVEADALKLLRGKAEKDTWYSQVYESGKYECNECGASFKDLTLRQYNYCTKCGWTHADQVKFETSLKVTSADRVVWSNKFKKGKA